MPTPRKPRLWPLVGIAVLAAGAWTAIWLGDSSNRQDQILNSLAVGVLAVLLAGAWLLLLSRLPWRTRLRGLGVGAALVTAAVVLVEVRGVTGDFVPILTWRWAGEGDAAARAAAGVETVVPGDHDWPGFYGPGRAATIDGPPLADWATPPRELWRRPVGPAWASVAIVGDALFTLEQHGADEVLARYRLADGEPVWALGWPARYETTIAGIGPRSTPTVDGDTVFAAGATGALVAVDAASGKLLWNRDVVADTGGGVPDWGKSVSPLVVDGLVVTTGGVRRDEDGLAPDGPADLVAYDRTDGSLVWRAGESGASYSSPQLAELAGERQLLIFNRSSVSGHRIADGTLLWSHPWRPGQPNVAQPLPLPGDRVLVSAGYGLGSAMLRIEHDPASQTGFTARELWSGPALKSKFANVLHREGALFGLDDGRFVAVDAETGKRRWKQGRYGHGQPILVGDRILVQAEDGTVVLLAADPEQHRELGTFPAFDSKTWNPPALSGSVLVVRNDREMAAYELPLGS